MMNRRDFADALLAQTVFWGTPLRLHGEDSTRVGWAEVRSWVGENPDAEVSDEAVRAGLGITEAELDEAMRVLFQNPIHDAIIAESELLERLGMDDEDTQVEETTGGNYIEGAHYWRLEP